MPQKTEDEIAKEWEAIQEAQRNPRRFQLLYEAYYNPVFLFVIKRTQDELIAEEVCSNVFLKALQNIKKYKFKGVPFSAWLLRIATNEVAQYYRETQKRRVVSIDERVMGNIEVEVNKAEKVQLEMDLTALKKAINSLKPDDLTLLELRFFEQRPFKEVAEILGITENNAKVKTYRLLKKMKKRMRK